MPNETAEPWTVLKLINWTKDYFERLNIQDPRLMAEMLLAHVLKCQRIALYTRFDYQLPPDELAAYRELVKRAGKLEPVAYMVGQREFYSLPFKVTKDVLIPRPETEILATEAIAHLKGTAAGRVWDVCTGSGCIGIAIASQVKTATVLATDISEKAVAVAQENAQLNKVADRVRCRVGSLLTLPEDCKDLTPFDVITGNPPYVADNQMITETVKHEPSIAIWGGPKGMDFLGPIIRDAPRFLRPGGALILEYGYAMADDIRDLIVSTGSFVEPRILRDHQGIERTVTAITKNT